MEFSPGSNIFNLIKMVGNTDNEMHPGGCISLYRLGEVLSCVIK